MSVGVTPRASGPRRGPGPSTGPRAGPGRGRCGAPCRGGGAVALVLSGHGGPAAAVAQGEEPGQQDQQAAGGGDVGPGGVAEGVDGGRRVTGRPGRLLVEGRAVGCAGPGAEGGAEAAEGQQRGDDPAARAAYGEDGDEGGEPDDGEGGGGARDVPAVGGQRQRTAAGGRLALGPGLAGGEEDDGRARRAQEQTGREGAATPRGIGCGAGRGVGGAGTGLGYGNSAHALHYPLPPRRPWSRSAVSGSATVEPVGRMDGAEHGRRLVAAFGVLRDRV